MRNSCFISILIVFFIQSSGQDSLTNQIDEKVVEFYQAEVDEQNSDSTAYQAIYFTDTYFEKKIAALDARTPIKLEYNEQVRKYIDIFTGKRKNEFQKIIGTAQIYFPIYEQKLDQYKLPLELKYLSVVESSLNPLAVSKSGAVGLWQFLLSTGKMFDLDVTSYIDERRDPFLSTEAACKYFRYLYSIFGDWQLAIASFNGGPGELNKAISRTDEINFWALQKALPYQTQNYVPAFIAMVYVMENAKAHGMYMIPSSYNYYGTDTVIVRNQMYLSKIAQNLGMSLQDLKYLNPIYKTDVVPASKNGSVLVLPLAHINKFIRKQRKITKHSVNEDNYWTNKQFAGDTVNKTKIFHTVQRGEFYHKIAMKYGCKIDDIKKWNTLTTDHLHPNQQLIIWVDHVVDQQPLQAKKPPVTPKKTAKGEYIEYRIQKGDTLWSIAQKFDLKSIDDIKSINQLHDGRIHPGQVIKINW